MLSLIVVISIILIIGTFIFLIYKAMQVSKSKLYNLYLAIVSLVSIIAVAITLGVVIMSVGKYILITDDEYLQNRESWKIDNCKFSGDNQNRNIGSINENGDNQTPSQEDIDRCINEVKENVSLSRSFDLKETFISSGAWFIVFLILFLFHYPKFIKLKD